MNSKSFEMKKILAVLLVFLIGASAVTKAQDMAIDPDLSIEPSAPQALSNTFLNRGLFSIEYNVSFPVGDFNDFISTIGYRGWHFELKGVLNDNVAVGGSLGWYAFYEKLPRSTYNFDGGAITTTIFNYYYSVPLQAVAHYYLMPDAFVQPFVGIGLGATYSEKRREIGFYVVEEKVWDFGVTPEVGAIIPFGLGAEWGAIIKGRYNLTTYKDNDVNNLMFFDLTVGLAFSY
jgi:outer membrane protein